MDPEELTSRLRALLRMELGDDGLDVDDVRRLTGGASRETWSFTTTGPSTGRRRFVLQRERSGAPGAGSMAREAALLRSAAAAGVPVAALVCSGDGSPTEAVRDLGAGYLISEFVDGESIARKIQRDGEYASARDVLAGQCGVALAAVHAIPIDSVPDLERNDQVARYRDMLDTFGDPHPAFELAFAWLDAHRPERTGETVVHGDFRLGNLLVGPDGLRAVVDWELAHLGDPMEDLGWLCVRAWRFGGAAPVAGLGAYDELFDAYAAASGTPVDPSVVRWWEVLGTLKWGIMCILQARAHLDGVSRSMELAAIGRRVCENEHDLLLLLAPDALAAAVARPEPTGDGARPGHGVGGHGRPTAVELVEAVREWVEGDVRAGADARIAFHSRVAARVLATVQRELEHGPAMAQGHADRLVRLGVADDAGLAAGIRSGRLAGPEVAGAVAETVVDKLRVANPAWFVGRRSTGEPSAAQRPSGGA